VSPEDLEQIRSLYRAIASRDLDALKAFAKQNPGFEWQSAPDEPYTDMRRGGETLAYSRELLETFEQLEAEIREVIDLGPDAAIFVVRLHARGTASGAEVEREEAHLWATRQGRVASLREFSTVEEARACAPRS
jgi:ketosteroid isomerase-like protein